MQTKLQTRGIDAQPGLGSTQLQKWPEKSVPIMYRVILQKQPTVNYLFSVNEKLLETEPLILNFV